MKKFLRKKVIITTVHNINVIKLQDVTKQAYYTAIILRLGPNHLKGRMTKKIEYLKGCLINISDTSKVIKFRGLGNSGLLQSITMYCRSEEKNIFTNLDQQYFAIYRIRPYAILPF